MTVSAFNQTTVQLEREECCNCHCIFAITSDMRRELKESHGTFYCPRGHGMYYTTESDLQRAEKAAQRAQELLAQERERVKEERARAESAKRSAAATRGQMTKLRNRVKKGVCPCCNRYFTNLHRHMTTQHPNYAESPRERHTA